MTFGPTATGGTLRLCDICGDDADGARPIYRGVDDALFVTRSDGEWADLCRECDRAVEFAVVRRQGEARS